MQQSDWSECYNRGTYNVGYPAGWICLCPKLGAAPVLCAYAVRGSLMYTEKPWKQHCEQSDVYLGRGSERQEIGRGGIEDIGYESSNTTSHWLLLVSELAAYVHRGKGREKPSCEQFSCDDHYLVHYGSSSGETFPVVFAGGAAVCN